MGLTPVPDDHLATVVTVLAMSARPPLRPAPPSLLRLARLRAPAPVTYRGLFQRIGEPWLWYSRLAMSEEVLARRLASPEAELYVALDRNGIEVGMLELDFGELGVAELTFLGLIPELIGQGLGRWLMAHALAIGWRPGVERMALQTCTLDHPNALGFYLESGFKAIGRSIETFPDPRLSGLLPVDCAPQVPMFGPALETDAPTAASLR